MTTTNRNCFECPDRATQIVEVGSAAGKIELNLCAAHADGYRRAEAWTAVYNQLRAAENAGDYELAAKLDEEQQKMIRDTDQNDDFPDLID